VIGAGDGGSGEARTVLLMDRSGAHLVAKAVSGLEEEVFQGMRVPVGKCSTGRVAELREPLQVEHGNRDNGSHFVRVKADAWADDLYLTVVDSGRWETPRHDADTNRGRGVPLMRAMMQHVTITPGPVGTTDDMHLRIR
jgi:hypothetical protein